MKQDAWSLSTWEPVKVQPRHAVRLWERLPLASPSLLWSHQQTDLLLPRQVCKGLYVTSDKPCCLFKTEQLPPSTHSHPSHSHSPETPQEARQSKPWLWKAFVCYHRCSYWHIFLHTLPGPVCELPIHQPRKIKSILIFVWLQRTVTMLSYT